MSTRGEEAVNPAAVAVHRILSSAPVSSPGDDASACEAIEALINDHGWPSILLEMLELLRSHARPEDWQTAAEVIWGAVLDLREMDADEVVAHLYYRLPDDNADALDDPANLAWSITAKLKHQEYLSAYDPLQDAGVLRVLERLRTAPLVSVGERRRRLLSGDRRSGSRSRSRAC